MIDEEEFPVRRYAVIADGIVVNVALWDGVTEWTPGDNLLVVQSDTAQIGWSYVDGEFVAPPPVVTPPPTPAEILANNAAVRDQLLAKATRAIAPLQDAVDLEDATETEIALLKKWKQYRVAVNRVDLTLAVPSWPAEPA